MDMINQVIIFLSSRKIGQVDFDDPSLTCSKLVLITAENEMALD